MPASLANPSLESKPFAQVPPQDRVPCKSWAGTKARSWVTTPLHVHSAVGVQSVSVGRCHVAAAGKEAFCPVHSSALAQLALTPPAHVHLCGALPLLLSFVVQ